MRNIKLSICIIFTAAFIITAGCRKKDLFPSVGSIAVAVNAAFNVSSADYNFPKEKIKVTITNLETKVILSAYCNSNGIVMFSNISAAKYNVVASASYSRAEYEAITNTLTEQDTVTFNGSLNNITLNNSTQNLLDLKLEVGKMGNWVLGQIYYAGSNTTNGASFRDVFVEIYNNSTDTLYADSLYFGQVMGTNTAAASVDLAKGFFVTDANDMLYRQYDWSKSIGMPSELGASAYKSYLYAKSIFMIPGDGKQHPVAPGKSILIASTAQNHKAPFQNSSGSASISVKNPELTVNLLGADFEVYMGDLLSVPFPSDVDNPNVPNMKVFDNGSGKDLIMDGTGRDSYMIFQTNINIVEKWKKYPAPDVTSISSSTLTFFQVPDSIIIDAVEIVAPAVNSRLPKKLNSRLDAGVVYVPGGSYSSQSLVRKVAKIAGGRKVLMDTNNSTNDFNYLEFAVPGYFNN